MNNIARGNLPAYDRGHSGTSAAAEQAGASRARDVADLVRRCSRLSGRHGFRVVARGSSGHIFFEAGRVIHAEFGEDCGLRAVVEMLRVGPVLLEAAVQECPAQPSLHLGPELLLSMTERDASRVMRKVELPVEPPPLPDPHAVLEGGLLPPVHPGALHGSGVRRAISSVLPRVEAPADAGAWGAAEPGAERVVSEPPGAAPSPPGPPSAGAPASARRAASRPASIPMSSITLQDGREPAEARARLPRVPAARVVRVQQTRSRSIVAQRAEKRPAPPGEASLPLPQHAPARVAGDGQPTTMVRVTSQGEVLAERGENSGQLAEAAAFIHGLANLIAADFGRPGGLRHGRANVHLSGRGLSLLVARSEVNDIAGALGPSERLTPLLRRVGLK
jgi:hypothetical protein